MKSEYTLKALDGIEKELESSKYDTIQMKGSDGKSFMLETYGGFWSKSELSFFLNCLRSKFSADLKSLYASCIGKPNKAKRANEDIRKRLGVLRSPEIPVALKEKSGGLDSIEKPAFHGASVSSNKAIEAIKEKQSFHDEYRGEFDSFLESLVEDHEREYEYYEAGVYKEELKRPSISESSLRGLFKELQDNGYFTEDSSFETFYLLLCGRDNVSGNLRWNKDVQEYKYLWNELKAQMSASDYGIWNTLSKCTSVYRKGKGGYVEVSYTSLNSGKSKSSTELNEILERFLGDC